MLVERRPRRRQAVEAPHAVLAGLDQAGAAQVTQVAGHGGLRELERLDDVADARLPGPEEVEEPQTRLVREGAEHGIGVDGLHERSIRCPSQEEVDMGEGDGGHVPTVLYVCVHNAGRSQIAAALTESLGGGRVRVLSAGSAPAERIHPNVRALLEAEGLDLSEARPKLLEDEVVRRVDVVITMGCGDACPVYPGKRYEDWKVEDPAGGDEAVARRVYEDIRARVEGLLGSLGA